MTYKHGAYGEIVPTQEKIVSGQGTIPFYVGIAPVHRTSNYQHYVNNSMIIRDLEDAQAMLGYSESDDFNNFTLCAAVYGHFKNRIGAIGPIIVVNVLNPDTHKKSVNASLELVNKVGYISGNIIIDSVSVNTYVKDIDYKVEYATDGRIKFTAINAAIASPVSLSYDEIDLSLITEAEIVGEYDALTDKRTGIQCIQTVYEDLNIIPNVLAAPGWSHKPAVEAALVAACDKFDAHYDAIVVTDLDSAVAITVEKALEWKNTSRYTSKREKTCWPKVKIRDKVIWMSILAIVRMQQTDSANGGIPYESPSNKPIDISGLVGGADTLIKINSVQANKLNEKGITTALFSGGQWVLWGSHMANYDYFVTDKPDEIFDVNIRMGIYLSNDFQLRNAHLVDSPIARNDIDGIINTEQLRLNSLISEGKLLYGKVEFAPVSNPIGDLIQGDFKFDTQVTNTPPGKSITNRIQYTSEGINTLLKGGGV